MGSSRSRTQSPCHVVDGQEYHCSNRDNDETGNVQLGHVSYVKQVERPAADRSLHDTEGDIEGQPFPWFGDQLTADEPYDQAKRYPRDDRRSLTLPPGGSSLLNNLIRPQQQRRWDRQAEGFSYFPVQKWSWTTA